MSDTSLDSSIKDNSENSQSDLDSASSPHANANLTYKGHVSGLKGLLNSKISQVIQAVTQNIEDLSAKNESSTRIPIEFVHPCPDQPRQVFDPESLEELSHTMKSIGQAQAITVRRVSKGYEIIAGERRYRAAKLAGLTHLDCIVKDCDEKEARLLALVENTQRQDLLPVEEALFLKKVLEDNPKMRLENLAKTLGSHKSTSSEKIQLTEIPSDLQNLLYTKKGRYFTHRHWRIISRVKDLVFLRSTMTSAIDHQLSVSELEKTLHAAGIKKALRNTKRDNTSTKQLSLIDFPIYKNDGDTLKIKALNIKITGLSEETRKKLLSEMEEIISLVDSPQTASTEQLSQ